MNEVNDLKRRNDSIINKYNELIKLVDSNAIAAESYKMQKDCLLNHNEILLRNLAACHALKSTVKEHPDTLCKELLIKLGLYE